MEVRSRDVAERQTEGSWREKNPADTLCKSAVGNPVTTVKVIPNSMKDRHEDLESPKAKVVTGHSGSHGYRQDSQKESRGERPLQTMSSSSRLNMVSKMVTSVRDLGGLRSVA